MAADEPFAPKALFVSPAALYLPLAYAGAGGLGRSHHGLSMSKRIDNLPDDHRLRTTFVKRAIRRVDGSEARAVQMAPYFVKALWDGEAGVFYSDTNIPGLTVEAATVDEFRSLVADLAPEMLAENAGIHDANVVVHFTAEQDMALAVA